MKTMKKQLKLKKGEKIFLLALIAGLMISLSACEKNHGINSCPTFPDPKKEVAQELQDNCYPEVKCPATWEWLNRIYKLKDQLGES